MTDKSQTPEVDVNEQIAQRKAKLAALREKGVAFQMTFAVIHWQRIFTLSMTRRTKSRLSNRAFALKSRVE